MTPGPAAARRRAEVAAGRVGNPVGPLAQAPEAKGEVNVLVIRVKGFIEDLAGAECCRAERVAPEEGGSR